MKLLILIYLVGPKLKFSNNISDTSNVTIYENNTLSLDCSVEGFPTPSIELFFNDKLILSNASSIQSNEFEKKLNYTFARIEKRDNGTYSCRYYDDSGKLEESLIHVFVYCKC